jgi:hypothetical protein
MKTRFWIILALVSAGFGLWQLANNAHQTTVLRNNITTLDQSGQDTTTALANLSSFSHNHMHASVNVGLDASYQRAVMASQAASQPSGTIYAQAQAACASHADSIVQARCVTDYVSAHLQPTATPPPPPDRSKYQYSYHSPLWAPDAAGLAFLASLVLLVLAVLSGGRRPKARF